jgi:tetratricopeptide (TPR) repeat protein
LNKYDYEVLTNIGNLFYKNGDYLKAIDYYKQALEIDKTFIIGFHNIILQYYRLGKFEEGLSYVKEALEISPNNLEILHLKALLLLFSNKIDFSLDICNKMLEFNLDDKMLGEVFSNIGLCHLVKLDYPQSKKFLEIAMLKYGEKKYSLFNLGSMHWIQSNRNESIEYFAESYRNFPDFKSFDERLLEVFKLLNPSDFLLEIEEIKKDLLEYLPNVAKKNSNSL